MITQIHYNWFQYSLDGEAGEDYSVYEVGKERSRMKSKKVVEIHEHLPIGAGDFHYCRVTFDDGSQERVKNVNKVITDTGGF